MKMLFAMAIGLFIAVCASALPERRNNVYFEMSSTQLSASNRLLLDTVYEKLPETNYMRIIPTGEIGSGISNSAASDIYYKRALAVYDYYQLIGVGEKDLEIIDNRKAAATASGMQSGTYRDADLEIRVYKMPARKEATFTSLSDYFQQDVQQFTIKNTEASSIRGKQGTVLNFPMNAFVCEDGTEPEQVSIDLMEFYTYADLMKSELHTMSNGNILETGGTINVKARCKNSEAYLTTGTQLSIKFPVKSWYKDGMQTFNGIEEDGNLDWIAADNEYNGPMDDWGWDSDAEFDTVYRENLEPPYDFLYMLVSRTGKNNAIMDEYLLKSGELGWINCDRFYDAPETTDFVVSIDTSFNVGVRMVFKDIKSVMGGYLVEKGKINFTGIPVGEVVTLVGCSVKDGVPYIAMKEIRITSGGYDQLKLVQTTKADMESKLMALK